MNKTNKFIINVDIQTDSDAWCIDYDSMLEGLNTYFVVHTFEEAKKTLTTYLHEVQKSLEGKDYIVAKLKDVISDAISVMEIKDCFYGEHIAYSNEEEEFLMDSCLGNQNISITIQEVSHQEENGISKFVTRGKGY